MYMSAVAVLVSNIARFIVSRASLNLRLATSAVAFNTARDGLVGASSIASVYIRTADSNLPCCWYCNPNDARIRNNIFAATRSEEHTSELQSLMRISYAVFCLKKKLTINQ